MSVYLIDNGNHYSDHSQHLIVVPDEIDSDFELFMKLEPDGMFMEAKMPSALLWFEGKWTPDLSSSWLPFYAHRICDDELWPKISGKVQCWLIHEWDRDPFNRAWHADDKYRHWLNPERWEPKP